MIFAIFLLSLVRTRIVLARPLPIQTKTAPPKLPSS